MDNLRSLPPGTPSLSVTINRQGHRVHRLIDDTNYPSRVKPCIPRRDPLVAALFGNAGSARTP
jgi:hypothetical protein